MESSGPPALLVTAIQILIAIVLAAFAVWRGERARAQGASALVQARLKRTYLCFLVWGAFVCSVLAVEFISTEWLAVVGIFAGIPAGLVGAVGIFHALMTWRERSVRVLLLSTLVLPGALAITDASDPTWVRLGLAVYGVGIVGVAVHGLRNRSKLDAAAPSIGVRAT